MADLSAIWPEGAGRRLGLAVSGGPDSLALLLLAQEAMADRVAVASVDHGLRGESAAECAKVTRICADLGVAHAVLPVRVKPGNIQSEARASRYAALAAWMAAEGLDALATAHHADDQTETLLMRLNRGSGVAGLAGVRARGTVPGSQAIVLRPLLGWRRTELAQVVADAGLSPVQDSSNRDPRYDRVRLRSALAHVDWLDRAALARSAAHLADADEALEWAAQRELATVVWGTAGANWSGQVPRAVALRVMSAIIARLGGTEPRGGAVAALCDRLAQGKTGTLCGVIVSPRKTGWRFDPEPARRTTS